MDNCFNTEFIADWSLKPAGFQDGRWTSPTQLGSRREWRKSIPFRPLLEVGLGRSREGSEEIPREFVELRERVMVTAAASVPLKG